uniref:Uncharacterized protein n=1 Tax=Trichogramma kaykai TaxID=54128 RepID=A0ABD2W7G2_9HYME
MVLVIKWGENESGTRALVRIRDGNLRVAHRPSTSSKTRVQLTSSHVHPVANFFVSSCMIDDDFMKMMRTACVHIAGRIVVVDDAFSPHCGDS